MEASAENHELLDALREKLEELTGVEREVIALYYGAGLNQRSISEHLGLSQQAISHKLKQVHEKLKESLKRGGYVAALPLLEMPDLGGVFCVGADIPDGFAERLVSASLRESVRSARVSTLGSASYAWLVALALLGTGVGIVYWQTQPQTRVGETSAVPEATKGGSENLVWDFSEGEKAEGLRVLTGEWHWDSAPPGGGGMVIDQAIALALPFKGDPKAVYRFDFKWRLLDLGKGMSIGVGWLDEGGHTLYAKVWGGLAKTGKSSTDWTTVIAFLDGNDLIYTQDGEPRWVYEMYEDGMPRSLGLRLLRVQIQTIRVQRIAREDIPTDLRDLVAVKRKVSPPRTNDPAP